MKISDQKCGCVYQAPEIASESHHQYPVICSPVTILIGDEVSAFYPGHYNKIESLMDRRRMPSEGLQ